MVHTYLFTAVHKDGASHPEISELASLGSFGIWTSNVHSQLTNKYLSTCSAPFADTLRVHAVDPKTSLVALTDCSVMAPHEWFGWLANRFPDEFDQLFLSSSLPEFWSGVSRSA